MAARARRVLEHLRRAAPAYAVLLVALALTLLAYRYVLGDVETSNRNRFDETVKATRDVISRRVDSHVQAIAGARAFFYASDSVGKSGWSGYADGIDLKNSYGGMRALGYAEYVRPDERNTFEEELSRDFESVGQSGPALRPGGEKEVYFPMKYIEPLDEANKRLVGYDTYSVPAHQAAMDQARDSGAPQSTSKVYLLSEAPSGSESDLALEPGLVVYLPIYHKDEPSGTVEERRRALDGFVVGELGAEELLGTSKEGFDPSIDFEVYDGEGLSARDLLYDRDGVLRAGESQERPPPGGSADSAAGGTTSETVTKSGRLSKLESLDVAGQKWNLYFEALPGFEENDQLSLFVLTSGLAVSLLLFGTTFVLIRNRLRAEKTGRELEDVNSELEATNSELEAFSYSVSHDLRAPLRSIDGFSQILLEDYAEEVDEEGKDYLRRVRSASQRMGQLIDDLLGLSRVTRNAMRRERVDLSSMAEEVAKELKERHPERWVEFSAQKGLETWGDQRLLRVALENLLGNAWKFTRDEPEPRIEFGRDEELSRKGRVPVYYVRDNGAGFDMAYADKLFGAFQRLHGTEEFDGTGIGLATVQRVVHRHGGRVWAKGAVGRGATFYFTLSPGLRPDATAPQRKEEVQAR